MKKHRLRLSRGVLAALLALAVLSTAGCQGFLANRHIKAIEAMLNDIRDLNPEKHKPTEWQQSNTELASIKNEVPTNPSSAKQRAEGLRGNVETLVTEVKSAEANDLQLAAREARHVMEKNEGRSKNPTMYDEIVATLTQGDTSLSEQQYDAAIRNFRQVTQKIDELLIQARQQAIRALGELRAERAQMDTYECPKYAPEKVTEVDSLIQRVDDLIEKERDYLAAEATAGQGKIVVQEGINKSNSTRAGLQIRALEQRLGKAVDEGAEIYCLDQYKQAERTHESIVQDQFNAKYENVLQTIEILRPSIDALIFCTLSSSINDKLSKLSEHIERHKDGGVPQYLPGRVERLEEKVQGAMADYEVTARNPEAFPALPPEMKAQIESSFARIKVQAQEAFILSDKIDAAFDDLAATALRDAKSELNVADDLYRNMEGAFMAQAPPDITPLDPSFTNNKESLRTELGRRIRNNSIKLDDAKTSRDEGRYRRAIELSREVESDSRQVQSNVYRVVADNAIIELENQITRFTREGAAEYATADLALTRQLLDESKRMMVREEYKNAVDQTSRTRAQLDVTLQVLGRSVLDKIEAAAAAISASEELRSIQFAPEAVGRARDLMERAQTELNAKNYRAAIQLAEQSKQAGDEAAAESGLRWSRNELDAAREKQSLADASRAIAYAPLIMRRAQNQYAAARELRDKGIYAEAARTAQEAGNSFNEAAYKQINDANEAILTARRSEGWKYEQGELTKAIVKAEEAIEAMNQGAEQLRGDRAGADHLFGRSQSLALQSKAIAQDVTRSSQRSGISERIKRIENSLQATVKTGANYFQVAEVKRLLKEAEAVKATAGQRTYEDLVEALNRIDAEFENILRSTPDRVGQLVMQQKDKLTTLEEEGDADDIAPDELRDARRRLEYVEIDFAEGNYGRAYSNLSGALKAVETVENRVAEQAYQIEVTKYFRDLNEALVRFDSVIRLGPDVLRRMAYGIEGRGRAVAISNALPPTQFKDLVDDVYLKILAIKPPRSRETLHQQVIKVVTEARLAASEFQKLLIFDELDRKTIDATIDAAYKHHDKMVEIRSEVQQRLINAGADLDGVKEQQVRPFERAIITSGI